MEENWWHRTSEVERELSTYMVRVIIQREYGGWVVSRRSVGGRT